MKIIPAFSRACWIRAIVWAEPRISVPAASNLFSVTTAIEEYPEIDDETLADTLEGVTDLRDMLAELVRSALDDEALASGLSMRLTEMRARVQRLEYRAEKKRELARRVMAEAEICTLL